MATVMIVDDDEGVRAISDVYMPDMDGIFLARIREAFPEAKTIMKEVRERPRAVEA